MAKRNANINERRQRFAAAKIAGRRTFEVEIRQSHILRGKPTNAGNPLCLAIKEGTLYRAAHVDPTWLELWDGKRWHLTLLPRTARLWLLHWLQGKEVRPRKFRIHQ